MAGLEWLALLAALAAAAVLAVAWLMDPRPPVAAGPDGGDPFADEVARFRRELHDWDRYGR